MEVVTQTIGPALSATSVRWQETSPRTDTEGLAIVDVPSRGVSADVTVPTTDRPRLVILVRDLRGGRRLLSDDVAMLESIAQLLGRRVDAIRIERERQEQSVREEEIRRLASEAELRALRAQINPHFLFNALTTIGYLIDAAPDRALATLLRLTQLLRRVLRSDGPMSTLGAELSLITAYLDIERARFEERLSVDIDVPFALHPRAHSAAVDPAASGECDQARHRAIPASRASGVARPPGSSGRILEHAHHHGAGQWPRPRISRMPRMAASGVGLRNIEERLERVYGDAGTLRLTSCAGRGRRRSCDSPMFQRL